MNCSVEVKQKREISKTYTLDLSTQRYWQRFKDFNDTHAIPQGSKINERNGRSVNVVSDYHRVNIKQKTTHPGAGFSHVVHVRVIAIMYKPSNGIHYVPVAKETLFEEDDRMLSYMNPNIQQYSKVFDRTFVMSLLPSTAAPAVYPTDIVFPVNMGKYLLRYKDVNETGTLVDGIANGYHELWVMTDTACSLDITVDSRLRWTDQ